MSNSSLIIPLIGLDGSGKSSLIARIKSDPADPKPTIGFQPFNCQLTDANRCKQMIKLYDLGGGPKIRGIWKNYFAECHALIFLIDLQSTISPPHATSTARPQTAAVLAAANTEAHQYRPQTSAVGVNQAAQTIRQLFDDIIGQHSFVQGKPILLLLNNKTSSESSTTSTTTSTDRHGEMIKQLVEETLAIGSAVPGSQRVFLQDFEDQGMQQLRQHIANRVCATDSAANAESKSSLILVQECALKGLFSTNSFPGIPPEFHQLQITPMEAADITCREAGKFNSKSASTNGGKPRTNKVEPLAINDNDRKNIISLSDALSSIDPRLKQALWALTTAVQLQRHQLDGRIKQDTLDQRRLYAQERYDRQQQRQQQQKSAEI